MLQGCFQVRRPKDDVFFRPMHNLNTFLEMIIRTHGTIHDPDSDCNGPIGLRMSTLIGDGPGHRPSHQLPPETVKRLRETALALCMA